MADSMPSEELQNSLLDDDYYTILNLPKDASQDAITNSYRRLCKLYHPDKHTDPALKKNAETLFNKIKAAHEVLIDPHKRAIYDTVGINGLKTEGWQIVQRTKTPQEIREEYEHLLKEKEDRLLQQRTVPKGTVSIGVNATDFFETYDADYGLPSMEITTMSITQSVEAPLDINEKVSFSGGLSVQNGTGSGNVNCGWEKTLSSNSSLQLGLSAGNGFSFSCKGHRRFSQYSSATLQTSFRFVESALSPGVELMLQRHFTKNMTGFMVIKGGSQSGVSTMLIREDAKGRFAPSIQVLRNGVFLSFAYTRILDDTRKIKGAIRFGTIGAVLEYSSEKRISKNTILGAGVAVGIPSGVTLRLKISRANQTFTFPILLCEEIVPSAIFYGTAAPLVAYYIFKTLYLDPYNKRQKERDAEKSKEVNAQKMAERKKEALIAVSLMQETYNRIKSTEEKKINGLVIVRAIYGSAEAISNGDPTRIESQLDIIDVTVQLQCLVDNSRLVLPDRVKGNLPGFYDPCVGEDKLLRVDYLYKNKNHSITVADNEMLRLPRLSES